MAGRGELRCKDNVFHTLLFRYDWRGIWVYCRDCRDDGGKRGQEHLVSWRRLLRLFLGMDEQGARGYENDQHS